MTSIPTSVASPAPIRVAIVGAGTWGINHVRCFARLPGCELAAVCDPDVRARSRAAAVSPASRIVSDEAEIFSDPSIDAVVIATSAKDHARQTGAALSAGKHVLCEKPFTLLPEDAVALCEQAEATGRVLMVGHLMLYHAAVLRLRQMIESAEIGEIYYLYSVRVNLGRVRSDESALWSLAPHDVSMILYLLDRMPVTVAARGQSYIQRDIEDVVFINMAFADGRMAQVQVSWLDPHKERRLTVVGSQRMVEFNDTHPTEKLRIYDKGVGRERPLEFTQYGEFLTLRQGDIHIPHIELPEPLEMECRHFIDCIHGGRPPRTDGREGLRVTQVLAAAQRSLAQQGVPVRLEAGG